MTIIVFLSCTGKPMKDYKERNKRDVSHNHVETELQTFSPSDITDSEVIINTA